MFKPAPENSVSVSILRAAALFFWISLASLPLFSQQPAGSVTEGNTPDWVRQLGPAPPLTREQIDAAVAGFWARSNDPAVKQQALDYLAPLIHSGQITADSPGALPLLQSLAGEGTREQLRRSGAVANDFPLLRLHAVELLSMMGGESARATVATICRTDPSPDVRAAAVTALVDLTPVPTAAETSLLRELLAYNTVRWRSDRLALRTLDAIAAVYAAAARPETPGIVGPRRVAPDLQDPALFQAVADVALGPFASEVRIRAFEVMNVIRDEKNR
ncbi:HEAT repeat domain-containing protein [Salinispira pacifica]